MSRTRLLIRLESPQDDSNGISYVMWLDYVVRLPLPLNIHIPSRIGLIQHMISIVCDDNTGVVPWLLVPMKALGGPFGSRSHGEVIAEMSQLYRRLVRHDSPEFAAVASDMRFDIDADDDMPDMQVWNKMGNAPCCHAESMSVATLDSSPSLHVNGIKIGL